MAREILFKGKRIDNGEWVEGSLLQTTAVSLKSFIVPSACYTFDKWDWAEWLNVDTDTICQWTGLLDKNGNKIWENDVVSTIVGNAIVIYVTERKCDNRYNTGFIVRFADEVSNKNYRHDLVYWIRHDTKCEVIGNIFDNKELLGGADNG